MINTEVKKNHSAGMNMWSVHEEQPMNTDKTELTCKRSVIHPTDNATMRYLQSVNAPLDCFGQDSFFIFYT